MSRRLSPRVTSPFPCHVSYHSTHLVLYLPTLLLSPTISAYANATVLRKGMVLPAVDHHRPYCPGTGTSYLPTRCPVSAYCMLRRKAYRTSYAHCAAWRGMTSAPSPRASSTPTPASPRSATRRRERRRSARGSRSPISTSAPSSSTTQVQHRSFPSP
eukprot:2153101-Rhodomonas_salina.1